MITARCYAKRGYAQNPLHTFPRNFPVNGEVANLLQTYVATRPKSP